MQNTYSGTPLFSLFRWQVPVTVATITLLSFAPQVATALDRVVKGTFSNLPAVYDGAPLFLSLETTEGIVHFTFRKSQDSWSLPSEHHLQGYRQLNSFDRTTMKKEPASLSIVGSRGTLYFRSRRHRRLSVARLSIHRAEEVVPASRPLFITRRISSYRVPQKTLCGMPPHLGEQQAHSGLKGSEEQVIAGRSSPLIQSRATTIDMPLVPPRVVTIATAADAELFTKRGSETNSYIRTVLNAVDALYSTQLGLRLRLIKQEVYTSPGSFVGNTAEEVLESFRLSTLQNSPLGEANVHHLFSGKDFLGTAIGLAFLGTACDSPKEYNFSVSQQVNEALVPVLVAHEIAHNLNATHDPALGAIMNPSLVFTDRVFSAKSLDEISTFVRQSGSCLAIGRLTQVTLITRIDSAKTFTATATASSAFSSQCTLKLYGAVAKATLSTPTRAKTGGKLLYTQTVSFEVPYAPGTFRIASPIPEKPVGAGRFFFRSALTCEGQSSWSPITEISLPSLASPGPTAKPSAMAKGVRWLGALAKGLDRS